MWRRLSGYAAYQRTHTSMTSSRKCIHIDDLAQLVEHQVFPSVHLTKPYHRGLIATEPDEVARCADRERLLTHARQWLYEPSWSSCTIAPSVPWSPPPLFNWTAKPSPSSAASILGSTLKRWSSALVAPREDGQHRHSWLWSAPAKHSTRQITEVLERITYLAELGGFCRDKPAVVGFVGMN
jgi:hypothetical protein